MPNPFLRLDQVPTDFEHIAQNIPGERPDGRRFFCKKFFGCRAVSHQGSRLHEVLLLRVLARAPAHLHGPHI
jgi:hypothetical protein